MTNTPPPTITPDGRTVITRVDAYLTEAFGRKLPKPRKVTGISELLLDDGDTVYECDQYDFVNSDVQRVVRHRSKHTRTSSHYDPVSIEKLLKYRELERAKSVRGWAERVAARLNKDKAPTPDGGRWFASRVSSLSRTHGQEAAAPAPHDPQPARDPLLDVINDKQESDLAQARAIIAKAGDMVFELNHLLGLQCDHDDYDELKAKAANFDQLSDNFKRLMG